MKIYIYIYLFKINLQIFNICFNGLNKIGFKILSMTITHSLAQTKNILEEIDHGKLYLILNKSKFVSIHYFVLFNMEKPKQISSM